MNQANRIFKPALLFICISVALCFSNDDGPIGNEPDPVNSDDGDYETWHFEELVYCTMGLDRVEDLMAKYNCTVCDRCFKEWNAAYYELNHNPICKEYEGRLYALRYEFECMKTGNARCVKTPDRCQYETCKLDVNFLSCLKNVKLAKLMAQ